MENGLLGVGRGHSHTRRDMRNRVQFGPDAIDTRQEDKRHGERWGRIRSRREHQDGQGPHKGFGSQSVGHSRRNTMVMTVISIICDQVVLDPILTNCRL